jgi:hypothetical protein
MLGLWCMSCFCICDKCSSLRKQTMKITRLMDDLYLKKEIREKLDKETNNEHNA